MSIYQYLQLQPVEPQDDGTTSDLDEFAQDETIDLTRDIDGEELVADIERLEKSFKEDSDPVTFAE